MVLYSHVAQGLSLYLVSIGTSRAYSTYAVLSKSHCTLLIDLVNIHLHISIYIEDHVDLFRICYIVKI